jgi:hypothetical protein
LISLAPEEGEMIELGTKAEVLLAALSFLILEVALILRSGAASGS